MTAAADHLGPLHEPADLSFQIKDRDRDMWSRPSLGAPWACTTKPSPLLSWADLRAVCGPLQVLCALEVAVERSGLLTSCRERGANERRCGAPADFILWGKMFARDALGPRCHDHAVAHAGLRMPSSVDHWAVIDLRAIRTATQGAP